MKNEFKAPEIFESYRLICEDPDLEPNAEDFQSSSGVGYRSLLIGVDHSGSAKAKIDRGGALLDHPWIEEAEIDATLLLVADGGAHLAMDTPERGSCPLAVRARLSVSQLGSSVHLSSRDGIIRRPIYFASLGIWIEACQPVVGAIVLSATPPVGFEEPFAEVLNASTPMAWDSEMVDFLKRVAGAGSKSLAALLGRPAGQSPVMLPS